MTTAVFAVLAVGAGLGLLVAGILARVRDRDNTLAKILELPYGERDVRVEALTENYSPLVEGTVGLAGNLVKQFDGAGSLQQNLERARVPLKPGEYVLIVLAGSLALAAAGMAIFSIWVFGVIGLLIGPLVGVVVIRRRIAKRRRAFEKALPDALTLIASSLSAGHTFLRAIQMMCEEAEPPLSEEFARLVSETRLGDPVVDALARMAERLQIRDLDWVVQAIRIQQTVGGKLADLLHTLADFIRAREEVKREVSVLTAEGRVSAWVLGAMAPGMLALIQFLSPDYMSPMYQGWGLIVLGVTGFMVATGFAIIIKMSKIEV